MPTLLLPQPSAHPRFVPGTIGPMNDLDAFFLARAQRIAPGIIERLVTVRRLHAQSHGASRLQSRPGRIQSKLHERQVVDSSRGQTERRCHVGFQPALFSFFSSQFA